MELNNTVANPPCCNECQKLQEDVKTCLGLICQRLAQLEQSVATLLDVQDKKDNASACDLGQIPQVQQEIQELIRSMLNPSQSKQEKCDVAPSQALMKIQQAGYPETSRRHKSEEVKNVTSFTTLSDLVTLAQGEDVADPVANFNELVKFVALVQQQNVPLNGTAPIGMPEPEPIKMEEVDVMSNESETAESSNGSFSEAQNLLSTIVAQFGNTNEKQDKKKSTFKASPSVQSSYGTQCSNCETNKTSTWRRVGGTLVCNPCGLYFKNHKIHRPVGMRKDTIQQRIRRKTIKTSPNSSPDTQLFNSTPTTGDNSITTQIASNTSLEFFAQMALMTQMEQ